MGQIILIRRVLENPGRAFVTELSIADTNSRGEDWDAWWATARDSFQVPGTV